MGAELIKATVINIYKKTLQLPEYPLSWPSELIMRPLGLAPPGAFDPAPRASGPLGLWAPSAPFSYPGGVRPLPSPPRGAEMGAWLTAVTPGEPVTVTWRVLGAQLVDRLRRLSLTKGSWRKNRNRVVNKRKPDSEGRGSFLSWPREAPRRVHLRAPPLPQPCTWLHLCSPPPPEVGRGVGGACPETLAGGALSLSPGPSERACWAWRRRWGATGGRGRGRDP